MTRARVAVLGAGWAGLAAAVDLAAQGVPVTVFESSRTLGGRARRVEANGVALDNGLHILIGAYRECLRLIARVNATDSLGLLRLPLDLHVLDHFRLRTAALPAPLHLAVGLARAEGLSWTERWRAVRFVTNLRATRFTLERDMSVAALLTQFDQGPATTRYLWNSLCTSALNTPPEAASAQMFLNVLRDSLNGSKTDSDLLLPRVDLSALFPEPAARFVEQHGGEIRMADTVDAVSANTSGIAVHSATRTETFSQVVCALPPFRVAEVLRDLPQLAPVARAVERLRYEPIYSVYLQYAAGARLPQPMFGLEGGLAQWVFDRGALCGQDGLIGVVISASGAHQELDQAALAARVEAELRSRFPQLGAARWTQVIAEKRATFACTVNVERPLQLTPLPNLFLAGDYTASDYPATLESAVRSGAACARMILETV